MKAFAIIPAAGRGRRMGMAQPKQYTVIKGAPVLVWTARALAEHPGIDGLVVAVPVGDEERVRHMFDSYSFSENVIVVPGGDDRQASVAAAIACMPECDVVLVHDAARPLVSAEVISRVLAAAAFGAVTAALPAHETVKVVDEGIVTKTLDRSRLWCIQTPQGFPYELLVRAHAQIGGERATDDCALVERLGETVRVVQGSPVNIKITTPADLPLAELWLERRSVGVASRSYPAVGLGYDVHRLVVGRDLILGGVRIPHEMGLLGHSDADVLLHACMDALLGAAGLGDIGQHFPDTSAAYAGVSSLALLRQVKEKLAAVGLQARGLDAVVVAERPRLAPYIPAIRANLAEAMGVSESCVNVKASTNEKMGFIGRQEGIAAQAVAWVGLTEGQFGSY